MKTICVALLAGFLVAGCTDYGPYRPKVGEKACQEPFYLGGANDERAPGGHDPRCAIQQHIIAGHETGYHLAFIEFDERKTSSETPKYNEKQYEAFKNHLAKSEKNYLIVFVHGWRHDAAIGDGDVRRFRVFLAYARSFLDQRCKTATRYCGHSLTGLYIGWRGRAFAEPVDNDFGPWTAGALPTFWSRKAQSEEHAKPVYRLLRDISRSLELDAGDVAANKMLVMGHSFGGNMLATALRDRMTKRIAAHECGATFRPPLGDLVFLVNPASEARNWTKIQRRLRERLGLSGTDTTGYSESFFPKHQRPVYVSFTSVCEWAEADLKKKNKNGEKIVLKLACDTATNRWFRWGQFAALKFDPETNRTFGHMNPDLEKIDVDGQEQYRFPYGASHEFSILDSLEIGTTFSGASLPERSECIIADNWLTDARNNWPPRGRRWDSAYLPMKPGETSKYRNLIFVSKKEKEIGVQFRHKLSPAGRKVGSVPSVVPANAPLWNVRSRDISKHGGYVNYPQWCAINQLVLDRVTLDPETEISTVGADAPNHCDDAPQK
ncbi:MAG: hypothetical protein KF899_12065 [Parvibaculum sp.]|nr:hypothetical protein [Parvibaculum sp.]